MRLKESTVHWFYTVYKPPAVPENIIINLVDHNTSNPSLWTPEIIRFDNKHNLGWVGYVEKLPFEELPSVVQYRLLLPEGRDYLTHYLYKEQRLSKLSHNRHRVLFHEPEEIQELLEAWGLR